MPTFEEAPDLQKIAKRLIDKIDNVSHVDIDEVLFLREFDTKPKALARCFKFGDHPVAFFTNKKYCIVFYWSLCDYMSEDQLTLLVLHELIHIPNYGNVLVNHDVEDFRVILGLDLDWAEPGQKVPNILKGYHGKSGTKINRIHTK